MSKSVKFKFAVLTPFIFLTCLSVCSATYIQWDGGPGGGGTDWMTAANWASDVLPGTADKAGFKTATGAVVSTAVQTFSDMTLGGTGGGILTLQPGAVLTCTNTWSMGQSAGENGVLNMSGGTVTVGNWYYVGNAGVGTINISGNSSITITGLLSIANGAAATSAGTVNLDGGTITAGTFSMAVSGGNAALNITGGKLIINGNVTGTIGTYITSGWIKGYGSPTNVHYDYNVTTANKTTVWATNSVKATAPNPANTATNIALDASLGWTAGPGAASHNVYFGETSPGVFQGNQTNTSFNPDGLTPSTIYYWRIDEVSGTGVVTTGDVWSFTTASAAATDPTPADGATGLSRNVTLDWTAGPGAASHNVYFGTTSPGTFQGNQTGLSFNPGQLSLSTKYYWHIDEVSDTNTVTTGDVWSFTVSSGAAKNADPANGATNVPFNKVLGWASGPNAASHDVYFGTTLNDVNSTSRIIGDLNGNGIVDWNDLSLLGTYWLADPIGTEPFAAVNNDSIVDFIDYAMLSQDWMNRAGSAFKGNQDANSFNAGTLGFNTTYYWRIDEVNGPDTIKGPVWSFTSQSGKAFNPSPVNTSSSVATNATLSWTAGASALSHDVYFGTTNPPAFIGNQSSTTYNPGALANAATYFWRIDEINGSGTVQGDWWSFTTVPLNTTPVYPYLTWRSSPTNSVVVNWWNPSAQGDSTVEYGTTASYGSSVTLPTVTNFHHVELTGLTSGTTYHYRVRSSDGTIGTDASYTVPAASTSSFTFAVYGDPRSTSGSTQYYARHEALCNWMLAQNFDFQLETGDTVWEGASPTGMSTYWPDFFRIESNLSKSKVTMAAMGNHEVQPSGYGGSANYQSFYSAAFPANGTDGANGRDYSFDYGNTHFVCLTSFQIDPVVTQKNWLVADLTTAKANPNIKWIFAYMHAPLYTTNGHTVAQSMIDAWVPVFDQFHVDIVFAGHNHLYERSHSIQGQLVSGHIVGTVVPDGTGTVYLTTGLGGAEFNQGTTTPLFQTWYSNQTAAVAVTVTNSQVTVQNIPNATGVPVDSFTLTK